MMFNVLVFFYLIINFNGNRIYLGIYEDPLSASIVYKLVRNELYKEDLKYVKKE
jgi:hypothetical protein